MAHHARGRLEQRLRRGIVQIDVIAVAHLEFQPAQGTVSAGLLLDRPVAAKPHVVADQIAGVGGQFRQDFFSGDRPRNVPRRVEQDIVDRGLKLRCLLVGLADDDSGGEYWPVVAEELKPCDGGIDDDPVPGHLARQPAQSLEIDRQLSHPMFRCCRPFRRRVGVLVSDALAGAGDCSVFRIGAAHRFVFG